MTDEKNLEVEPHPISEFNTNSAVNPEPKKDLAVTKQATAPNGDIKIKLFDKLKDLK